MVLNGIFFRVVLKEVHLHKYTVRRHGKLRRLSAPFNDFDGNNGARLVGRLFHLVLERYFDGGFPGVFRTIGISPVGKKGRL